MEIPLQVVLFGAPALLYVLVRLVRRERWEAIAPDIGWTPGKPQDYLEALGAFALLAVAFWAVLRLVPPQLLQGQSHYAGWSRTMGSLASAALREAFLIALGEEVFFRGLLGGWLTRRLGFTVGNLIQSVIFLLPHLLLLQLGTAIWPVFLVQFAAGWLQGWLRHRSDSILPGWLVHTLTNTASALSAMS